MIVNGVIIIPWTIGCSLNRDTSSGYSQSSDTESQPSYKGKSFSECYEDELRKVREREQLEELKK